MSGFIVLDVESMLERQAANDEQWVEELSRGTKKLVHGAAKNTGAVLDKEEVQAILSAMTMLTRENNELRRSDGSNRHHPGVPIREDDPGTGGCVPAEAG